MPRIGSRHPHKGAHARLARTVGLVVVLVWAILAVGCSKEDTGQCCSVLDPAFMDRIPQPEVGPDGSPRSVVRLDPKFDCENLVCVSYSGSKAFCTKQCEFDESCPEGFRCAPAIESDPGPDSQFGPDSKFCVRDAMECLAD
jgi:hypothetical protein